jgi:hypothetical protein
VSVERSLAMSLSCVSIFLLSSPLEWSMPSPFIDARETHGYMHALRDVFPRKEDPRSPVVGGVPLLGVASVL